MAFGKLFKKSESCVGLDIGSSTIKLVEFDLSKEKPVLLNVGVVATPSDAIQNNVVSRPESIADALTSLFEENNIADKRVCLSLPGTSVFTKRVRMAKMGLNDLTQNVQLEAGNFIPHGINNVKLDYHILGESGRNQIDVLVVAAKTEIIDGYLDALALAGLEAAIMDVDFFALQNTFELGYPDISAGTVGLINVGSRFSCINICRAGECLFTGDVPLGGKLFTENLAEHLGVAADDAEQLKRVVSSAETSDEARELIEKNVEYAASELNRQLSFLWTASGAEETIDRILISGGGARISGLIEELSEKTGIACDYLDPVRGVEIPETFDRQYLTELTPLMSIAVGLGLRQTGDKIIPEFMD